MFPHQIYNSAISGQSTNESTRRNNESFHSDYQTRTEHFAKSLASFLIGFENQADTSGKIPPELIFLGAIFLSKAALALSLRQASKAGLNLSDL